MITPGQVATKTKKGKYEQNPLLSPRYNYVGISKKCTTVKAGA
jgi:hypothetical protein